MNDGAIILCVIIAAALTYFAFALFPLWLAVIAAIIIWSN